jgi:tetratricopeptide (TPR) repeat protein
MVGTLRFAHPTLARKMNMKYDFNDLERAATRHIQAGRHRDALAIYFYMSDGDPSLDGGYLAKRIAQCYTDLGELHAAKYWYGRAIEENAVVNSDCIEARKNLGNVSIDELL